MRKLIPTGYVHAKQGGPPDDWATLQVINLNTGELMPFVSEVNVLEGWVKQTDPVVPDDRIIETWPEKMIFGNFEIVRTAEIEDPDDRPISRTEADPSQEDPSG